MLSKDNIAKLAARYPEVSIPKAEDRQDVSIQRVYKQQLSHDRDSWDEQEIGRFNYIDKMMRSNRATWIK